VRSVKARRKRERYIDRWRRDHPEVRLYLKKEEYELLREIATASGMTIKEVVMRAIRDLSALEKAVFKVATERVFKCVVEGCKELELIEHFARKYGIECIEWKDGIWCLLLRPE